MENFEKASRLKLRFATNKGQLTTEDLWDLSLVSLDTIAKSVNKSLKEDSEESFIAVKTSTNVELELKLEILKHIIAAKIEARDKEKARTERRHKLSELKQLAASKQMEELGSKSLADINKMISDLENED